MVFAPLEAFCMLGWGRQPQHQKCTSLIAPGEFRLRWGMLATTCRERGATDKSIFASLKISSLRSLTSKHGGSEASPPLRKSAADIIYSSAREIHQHRLTSNITYSTLAQVNTCRYQNKEMLADSLLPPSSHCVPARCINSRGRIMNETQRAASVIWDLLRIGKNPFSSLQG